MKTKGDVDTALKAQGGGAAMSEIGDKMRSLAVMDSPATPGDAFGGFGYERSVGATPGTAARKKAAGLGAAAMAAAAGVDGRVAVEGRGGSRSIPVQRSRG